MVRTRYAKGRINDCEGSHRVLSQMGNDRGMDQGSDGSMV